MDLFSVLWFELLFFVLGTEARYGGYYQSPGGGGGGGLTDPGEIAGVVIGSVGGIVLVTVGIFLLCHCLKLQEQKRIKAEAANSEEKKAPNTVSGNTIDPDKYGPVWPRRKSEQI